MSFGHPVYHAARGVAALSILCLAGASLLTGCTDLKKSMGLEPTLPDEFAVESRAPLTIPPDFDLRPPQPGADFRLRRTEDGLPDTGRRSAQAPDPNGTVGDQSLSSKLLGYDGASDASGAVEKRETTPLKGVY